MVAKPLWIGCLCDADCEARKSAAESSYGSLGIHGVILFLPLLPVKDNHALEELGRGAQGSSAFAAKLQILWLLLRVTPPRDNIVVFARLC